MSYKELNPIKQSLIRLLILIRLFGSLYHVHCTYCDSQNSITTTLPSNASSIPQKLQKTNRVFKYFFYAGKESVDSDSIVIVHENLGQEDSLQVLLSFHIGKTSL